jgi:hypothetical protein
MVVGVVTLFAFAIFGFAVYERVGLKVVPGSLLRA